MDGVNLMDAVLALQILSKLEIPEILYTQADVDGDGKIGLEEVIYILQDISELR